MLRICCDPGHERLFRMAMWVRNRLPSDVPCTVGHGVVPGAAVLWLRQPDFHELETANTLIERQGTVMDKYMAYSLAKAAGVKCVPTFDGDIPEQRHAAFCRYENLVCKPRNGSMGRGLFIAKSESDVKAKSVLQPFVDRTGRFDIRVNVIGYRAICAERFLPADGEWNANYYQGGTPMPIRLTDELVGISEAAALATGSPLSGLDLFETKDGLLFNEINTFVDFWDIQRMMRKDVMGVLVDFVANKYRAWRASRAYLKQVWDR